MAETFQFLLVFFLVLGLTLIIYIKIAKKFKATTPLKRNTGEVNTVVGAGIIFPLSIILISIFFNNFSTYFLIGLFVIASVSFIDDLRPIKISYRLPIQIIACLLVFYSQFGNLNFSTVNVIEASLLFMLFLGYINTSNFMDGINGMLGLNASTTIIALTVINYFEAFIHPCLLFGLLLSSVLFLIGNFRLKPVFIAGDVGSISMGFILGYFILKIYMTQNNPIIFLLIALYVIDVGMTLVINLKNRVNVFRSHRNHLYEKLVYSSGISDLKVSGIYGAIQILLSFIVVISIYFKIGSWLMLILSTLSLTIIYFIFRCRNFRNETRKGNHN